MTRCANCAMLLKSDAVAVAVAVAVEVEIATELASGSILLTSLIEKNSENDKRSLKSPEKKTIQLR